VKAVLAIFLTGLGTYLFRALFIVALSGRRFPPVLLRALEYVAPAVMAALVVSMLVGAKAQPVPVSAAQLGGLGCAVLVAWKTRNHVVTLCAAMAVFWLLGALTTGG